MIALTLQILAAWCIGWWGRGWWTRAVDTTAQARIACLEAELDQARQLRAIGSDMYLDRLKRCDGCATCNPEPQGLDLTGYEHGAPE
jgi:hypothetical protein